MSPTVYLEGQEYLTGEGLWEEKEMIVQAMTWEKTWRKEARARLEEEAVCCAATVPRVHLLHKTRLEGERQVSENGKCQAQDFEL